MIILMDYKIECIKKAILIFIEIEYPINWYNYI